MNILHHKSWHVRTKENIARVRRDEAKAAQEAKELERRIKLADQETRTNYLRKRAKERTSHAETQPELLQQIEKDPTSIGSSYDNLGEPSTSSKVTAPSGHVNFFQDLEAGEMTVTTNKEREEEEKKEKEEHEKKIGLLTYLGQDSQELTGERSWWQKLPENRKMEEPKEENLKTQKHLDMLDPLSSVRKYLGCKGVQSIASNAPKKEEQLGAKKKKRKRKRQSSNSSSEEVDILTKKHKKKSTKRNRRKHKHHHSRNTAKKKSKKSRKSKSKKRKRLSSKSSSTSNSNSNNTSDSESDDTVKNRNEHDWRQSRKHRLEEEEKRIKTERLRVQRIEREKKERVRKNELLYGIKEPERKGEMSEQELVDSQRKYNSQFNPQFAKQNKLDASEKYWL